MPKIQWKKILFALPPDPEVFVMTYNFGRCSFLTAISPGVYDIIMPLRIAGYAIIHFIINICDSILNFN